MVATSPQNWELPLVMMAEQARHSTSPRTRAVPFGDRALLDRAYAHCEAVIAEHGKTFNLATRLLPPAKRRAMRALYAFCRVADNIVDCSDSTKEAKNDQLLAWRQAAVSLAPRPANLVATAWADTRLRYNVPYEYAYQLIDGVALDLCNSRYETFDELTGYAYAVASTVGLMSMRIIGLAPGCSEERAIPFVIKLGVALQITNILRDVREDLECGRLYLPRAELAAFGLAEAGLREVMSGGAEQVARWQAFMRFQVERNRTLYREAWPCISMFNRDGRFAVAAACSLYSTILEAIEANNYDVFSHRAHVSARGKLRRLPGIWLRNC